MIASRSGVIECGLHRTCYTFFYSVLLNFVCMYITLHICLFYLPILSIFHTISFTEGPFITRYFLWFICSVLLIVFLPDVLVKHDEIKMLNQCRANQAPRDSYCDKDMQILTASMNRVYIYIASNKRRWVDMMPNQSKRIHTTSTQIDPCRGESQGSTQQNIELWHRWLCARLQYLHC